MKKTIITTLMASVMCANLFLCPTIANAQEMDVSSQSDVDSTENQYDTFPNKCDTIHPTNLSEVAPPTNLVWSDRANANFSFTYDALYAVKYEVKVYRNGQQICTRLYDYSHNDYYYDQTRYITKTDHCYEEFTESGRYTFTVQPYLESKQGQKTYGELVTSPDVYDFTLPTTRMNAPSNLHWEIEEYDTSTLNLAVWDLMPNAGHYTIEFYNTKHVSKGTALTGANPTKSGCQFYKPLKYQDNYDPNDDFYFTVTAFPTDIREYLPSEAAICHKTLNGHDYYPKDPTPALNDPQNTGSNNDTPSANTDPAATTPTERQTPARSAEDIADQDSRPTKHNRTNPSQYQTFTGWYVDYGKYYWYEEGVRQGTESDPKGVWGDGTNRGREIYDPYSDAWYWLDAAYDGARAEGKEVWIPYIYQDEKSLDYNAYRSLSKASDNGMQELAYQAMKNHTGKWVRYDGNGAMIKGWVTIEGPLAQIYPDQAGNTYYYDTKTGLMAKGTVTLAGKTYHFDEVTGALKK